MGGQGTCSDSPSEQSTGRAGFAVRLPLDAQMETEEQKKRLTGKQGCLIVAVLLFAALWGLKTWFIYEECFVNYGARIDNPTIYYPECTLVNAFMAPFVSLERGQR